MTLHQYEKLRVIFVILSIKHVIAACVLLTIISLVI